MSENIIDLKSKLTPKESSEEKTNFEIHHITKKAEEKEEKESFLPKNPFTSTKEKPPVIAETPQEPLPPSKTIEVDFAMFSELIQNPNSKKIIQDYGEEKIHLSANLLTKLASATEAKDNNRLSIIFCVGLIIGIAFAWVLLNEF